MIRISDIDVGAEHIVIAYLDVAAGINHQVSIEIVVISNSNPDAVVVSILRPQTTACCERVVVAQDDVCQTTAAPSFHAITATRR